MPSSSSSSRRTRCPNDGALTSGHVPEGPTFVSVLPAAPCRQFSRSFCPPLRFRLRRLGGTGHRYGGSSSLGKRCWRVVRFRGSELTLNAATAGQPSLTAGLPSPPSRYALRRDSRGQLEPGRVLAAAARQHTARGGMSVHAASAGQELMDCRGHALGRKRQR